MIDVCVLITRPQLPSQGSSERALDELVTAALAKLDDVETGYRSFHSTMMGIAHNFPHSVQKENATYHVDLCRLLQVTRQEGVLIRIIASEQWKEGVDRRRMYFLCCR